MGLKNCASWLAALVAVAVVAGGCTAGGSSQPGSGAPVSDPAYQDPPPWEKIARDAPAGRNYAGELFDPHGGSAALDSVAQVGERANGEMFAINLVAMIEAGRRSDVAVVEDYFGAEVHPLAVEQLERLMVATDGVVSGGGPRLSGVCSLRR